MKNFYKYFSTIVILLSVSCSVLNADNISLPTQQLSTATADTNDITISGTYGLLTYSNSGTPDNPIVIRAYGAKARCVQLLGDNIVLMGITVEGCQSHGIFTDGNNVTIKDNIVRNSVLEGCKGTGGWGSAIKVRIGGNNIVIEDNIVYKNCGEGIGVTRGSNVIVRNNTVTDNWSVNIYIDNSYNVEVVDNYTGCFDPAFQRGGLGSGITLGAEFYEGWGVQLHDVTIDGNVIEKCRGIRNISGGLPENIVIKNNMFISPPVGDLVNVPNANVSNNYIITPTPFQTTLTPTKTPTITSTLTKTKTPTPFNQNSEIIVSNSEELTKAMKEAQNGDTIILRGGVYTAPSTGWEFSNSGVTLTNQEEETAFLYSKSSVSGNYIIKCLIVSPEVHNIKIIGKDNNNGEKGIVMMGDVGGISPAIVSYKCDNWEISGIEFRDVGYAIFQRKVDNGKMSSDKWYVHNTFTSDYYRESGMQFNGNYNIIERNIIIKKTDVSSTSYGCQLLNILGNNNTIRENHLERIDQTVRCIGIFFEWDLSDKNVVEYNKILGVPVGISFYGGDYNLVKNNVLTGTDTAFVIRSWENGTTSYPCNFSEFMPLEEDVTNPDWQYMYPNDCRSKNNIFEQNNVSGFSTFSSIIVPEPSNVFIETTITPTSTIPATSTVTPTHTITPTQNECLPKTYDFNHYLKIRTGNKTLRLRAEPNSTSYIIGHLFDTRDQLPPNGVPIYIEKVVKLCNGDVWAQYGGYFALRISNYYGYTDVNPEWLP